MQVVNSQLFVSEDKSLQFSAQNKLPLCNTQMQQLPAGCQSLFVYVSSSSGCGGQQRTGRHSDCVCGRTGGSAGHYGGPGPQTNSHPHPASISMRHQQIHTTQFVRNCVHAIAAGLTIHLDCDIVLQSEFGLTYMWSVSHSECVCSEGFLGFESVDGDVSPASRLRSLKSPELSEKDNVKMF